MNKKVIYINLIVIFLSYLLLDILISNTYLNLKKKTCYKFEEFYYELKKNCKGLDKFKSGFPTVNVYTDQNGLRIGKNDKRKKEDKIFIFGDSFTFGVGLEYKDTYTGLLAKEFKSYDFYNFAVGSYSPSVHLYKLEEQIKKNLIPKKIILFLDMTDVHDEGARWVNSDSNNNPMLASNLIFNRYSKNEKFTHKNFKITRSLAHFINYNLRVLRSGKKSIDNKNTVKTSLQAGFTYRKLNKLGSHYENDIFNKGQNKIKQKINQISNIAKENNSDFYLVVYPFAETLVYGQKIFNWENFAKNLCKNNNCKLINTFEAFRYEKEKNDNWYSKLYFVGDEHFNKGGNKIIAEVLKNEIFKR